MRKLYLFIIFVLIIFVPGCNKTDIDDNISNNNSEQVVISESDNPKNTNIGSRFMGTWYYTIYSSPNYADDFEKIEIVPYGKNQAKVLWADDTEDIFEITSENEGIGTYKEIEKARYSVGNEDGEERFNVTAAYDGQSFQPGIGGYRTIPDRYKTKAEEMKKELKDCFNNLLHKEIPNAPQQTMNIKSAEIYDEWDRLLNRIYGYLKESMPQKEFAALQNEELDWIERKENAIAEAGNEYDGGSMAQLAMNSVGIEYTKERCEYLLLLID